jgi:hypothetical protein
VVLVIVKTNCCCPVVWDGIWESTDAYPSIGPSEVRALPVRRCRRAAWQTLVATINGKNLSSSFFSFTYFSPRRSCPKNFSIQVLAISDNYKISKKKNEVVFHFFYNTSSKNIFFFFEDDHKFLFFLDDVDDVVGGLRGGI